MAEHSQHVWKYLHRLIYSGVLQSAQFYLFMWLFWRTPSTLKIAQSSRPHVILFKATIVSVTIFVLNKCSQFLLYPATKCGEVLCYTLRCLSVCPSVRPSAPFPIDNLSIYSRNFFKFCIHIVNGDEWYGIVNGQNPAIFNGVTALFRIGKMVSGLLFLYCS